MIKPLGKRIIVKPVQEGPKEFAGIIVTNKQEDVYRALVLSGGDEEVKVGDTVLISRSTGIPHGDNVIIGLVDVLAVVEE